MRQLACIVIALVLGSGSAHGQDAIDATDSAVPPVAPDQVENADAKAWSFSLSISGYFIPDDDDYVQFTFTADYDWLHLEARYQYEDLDTGSLWAGYNFSGGEELAWEFTPMIGGVFGDTTGVALGYKGSLSWWLIEFYSEGEFVFDTSESSDSFFYNWSELTLAPVEWFRFGVVIQRTRVYESDRDVQPGVLVGFSLPHVDITAYVLNPDEDKPIFILTFGVSF